MKNFDLATLCRIKRVEQLKRLDASLVDCEEETAQDFGQSYPSTGTGYKDLVGY